MSLGDHHRVAGIGKFGSGGKSDDTAADDQAIELGWMRVRQRTALSRRIVSIS
jgi:hypothetical protein